MTNYSIENCQNMHTYIFLYEKKCMCAYNNIERYVCKHKKEHFNLGNIYVKIEYVWRQSNDIIKFRDPLLQE